MLSAAWYFGVLAIFYKGHVKATMKSKPSSRIIYTYSLTTKCVVIEKY